MHIKDCRRLTGPNIQCGGPAAIAEVNFEAGDDPQTIIADWREALARAAEHRRHRRVRPPA